MTATAITFESLGLTKEELAERVIERICERALTSISVDDEGEGHLLDSQFKRRLDDRIKDHIALAIDTLAEKHVLPNVGQYIENLTLQETNRWGEKTGQPVTFTEYLVQRAEAYMREEVNYEGKTKAKCSFNGWNKTQTRIAHLVHKHLHWCIETAMKEATKNANAVIVEGIEQTVRIKLQAIADALKVSVKTK